MPTWVHGKLLYFLIRRLPPSCTGGVEVRMRIAEDVVRIPDLSVFLASAEPAEQHPSQPPLVTVEVLSPDDRHVEVMRKCHEYREWGVPNIWVIDPEARKLYVYTAGLSERDRFELPELGFTLSAAELFAAANA